MCWGGMMLCTVLIRAIKRLKHWRQHWDQSIAGLHIGQLFTLDLYIVLPVTLI